MLMSDECFDNKCYRCPSAVDCDCGCHNPAAYMSPSCETATLKERWSHLHDDCTQAAWCQCPCHPLRIRKRLLELRERFP